MMARPNLPSPTRSRMYPTSLFMMPNSGKPELGSGEGAERGTREAGEGASRVAKARRLRRDRTDAERKLWFALKDRRFNTTEFRRQAPIGNYIADFACFELRLILEVDGGQHADSTSDEQRDRWFAANGFRVLRFWNNEVLSNLSGVLERISLEIATTPHPASRLRSPPPSPAGGEGEGEIAR
jgi:very-short-patch-repair endonuclease